MSQWIGISGSGAIWGGSGKAPDGDRPPVDQSAGAKAIRSMPSTTSKWASLLNTGRTCWRARAAIQTSLGGMASFGRAVGTPDHPRSHREEGDFRLC